MSGSLFESTRETRATASAVTAAAVLGAAMALAALAGAEARAGQGAAERRPPAAPASSSPCRDLPAEPPECSARETPAVAVRVLRADLLEVRFGDDAPARVRLAGVSVPSDPKLAAEAVSVLTREAVGRQGALRVFCPEWQTGREVAAVFRVGETSVNEELVRRGLVGLSADDEGLSPESACRLTSARDEARAARRGIWRDRQP